MSMTDPIADLLTRIRNGLAVRKTSVDIPKSKEKQGVAEVLKREGYLTDIKEFDADGKPFLRIFLKYGSEGEEIINSIQRVSKPGRRVYRGYRDLKPVLRGIGIHVVSTPKGMLSDIECRDQQQGGEVVARVY